MTVEEAKERLQRAAEAPGACQTRFRSVSRAALIALTAGMLFAALPGLRRPLGRCLKAIFKALRT